MVLRLKSIQTVMGSPTSAIPPPPRLPPTWIPRRCRSNLASSNRAIRSSSRSRRRSGPIGESPRSTCSMDRCGAPMASFTARKTRSRSATRRAPAASVTQTFDLGELDVVLGAGGVSADGVHEPEHRRSQLRSRKCDLHRRHQRPALSDGLRYTIESQIPQFTPELLIQLGSKKRPRHRSALPGSARRLQPTGPGRGRTDDRRADRSLFEGSGLAELLPGELHVRHRCRQGP